MKRIRWTNEMLQEEALKFNNKRDFHNNSPAYKTASFRGILDDICKHMPEVSNFPWSIEELQEEALKYKSRKHFQINSNAYQVAQKRKILDQICSHMPKHMDVSGKNHSRFKWTLEKLQIEALKYNNRGDLFLKNLGAYKAAVRLEILDEICKHMNKSHNISKPEQNLFDTIKNIYPKTQILRKRSIKIENKPHIKGFDLDIYIPELRKGIEFDGRYYHSFSGLKRARPSWSDDDIINYHQLKDSYFLSKNIKVIHVKEEDWIKNKQACIDKCLEFLDNKL